MKNFDAIKPPPSTNSSINFKPRKHHSWRKLKWLLIFLILAGGIAWGYSYLSKTNQIFTNQENIFTRFGKLIVGADKSLTGEDSGQVNILLLGIGGPGHEGPYLTDTMIVASINVKTSEIVLTSIPRDFVVSLPNRGFQKINAAYAYGQEDSKNGGGSATIAAAEKVTGLTIPYYAVLDFSGFVKAVDHVGGLDIAIDRTFTDDQYPDEKNGYLPPITFTKGFEHMNGIRALEFARSRHSVDNNEGSDFARSERQKKILVAFKQKVSRLNITDLRTINNLLNDFTQNFRTNLEPYEIKRLADLAKNIPADQIYSLSLEPQGDLICAGLIEDYTSRAYVIQPCEGKTLQDVHQYLSGLFITARLKTENATIEIQNSTGQTAALKPWQVLAASGLTIKFVSFKGKNAFDRTIAYDNSKHSKPKTLEYLQNNFKFALSDVPYYGSSADFVIILGKDSL